MLYALLAPQLRHTSEENPPESLPRSIRNLCAVCTILSCVISFSSILLQLRNYRKPALQRLVVRIQMLVPLYAFSSWFGLIGSPLGEFLEPIKEVYEAFVIYTFFSFLTKMLGGERNILLITSGRAPKRLLFPFYLCFPKIDISDPYAFLAVKRGILQYTWLKPLLCLAIIVCQATGTYHPNYIGITSGYMWISVLYNLSVSLSLYSLALFWYCLLDDLRPFNPLKKFLCVKLIIFASYWQGFALSLLQFAGVIHDIGYYSRDHIAAIVQNALLCVELVGFAVLHAIAFSHKEYATESMCRSAARLPSTLAARDALLGTKDLLLDFRNTFSGSGYGYRQFDSVEAMLDHPESRARMRRISQGLRYVQGGKGKYWLPERAEQVAQVAQAVPRDTSALLGGSAGGAASRSVGQYASTAGLGIPGGSTVAEEKPLSESEMAQDDQLYEYARQHMPYGDWNYPVISPAAPPPEDSRMGWQNRVASWLLA